MIKKINVLAISLGVLAETIYWTAHYLSLSERLENTAILLNIACVLMSAAALGIAIHTGVSQAKSFSLIAAMSALIIKSFVLSIAYDIGAFDISTRMYDNSMGGILVGVGVIILATPHLVEAKRRAAKA